MNDAAPAQAMGGGQGADAVCRIGFASAAFRHIDFNSETFTIVHMMDVALEPIVWTVEFEVGVAEIDDDHRVLVALHNDMVCAVRRSISATMTKEIALSLGRFVRMHIRREEARMPDGIDLSAHLHDHRECEAVIAGLESRGADELPLAEIAGLLRAWILGHVLVHDRVLFTHLRQVAEADAQASSAPQR